MTLKALIFDVFGACFDWRTDVAGAIEAAFAAKGIEIDGTEIADAWRAEYQPAMEGARSGARGYLQLDDLHLENLHRALSFRDRGDVFDEAELIALNQAWERLPP